MESPARQELASALADVARLLQHEPTAQLTLQKIVELAPATIRGCDHAGVSMVVGPRVETPAASDPVPGAVDLLQQETGQGPCLDAIAEHQVFTTGDLAAESRWPLFSARAVAETGVRSVLSFRLFVEQDTLGSLNLYSLQPHAFGPDSRAGGAVFAAHAAVALTAAREHDRAVRLQQDLTTSQDQARDNEERVAVAVAVQRSLLTRLPALTGIELTARYLPAMAAAEVGGDWYDAFSLPGNRMALVVGDAAGHDVDAAVRMSELRSVVRTLAIDRDEQPGDLLRRVDRVTAQLPGTATATCVYAVVDQLDHSADDGARLTFANAGHLPPLLITADGTADYLGTAAHLMLGIGVDRRRTNTVVRLPSGSILLLYTDGLIERRDRPIDDGLAHLQRAATDLASEPFESFCEALSTHLVTEPEDDICLLALRIP